MICEMMYRVGHHSFNNGRRRLDGNDEFSGFAKPNDGGFVAKCMGDGVLIYFGYPEAHMRMTLNGRCEPGLN